MNMNDMISPVIRDIPPSGIRKFFDVANEMKDVVSLGVGEPDFVTPWHIREAAIYSLERGHTHYTSNNGLSELRFEISQYLNRKFQLNYDDKTQILITVGGSEAIDAAIRSVVTPGDEVLIPEPSFVCYKPCTLFAGGVPVPIATQAKNNFKLTAEELTEKITPKTKLLILPYPNNPTGAIMEKQDIEAIADVLKDKDILILSDEIYAELTYDRKHFSIANVPYMKDRTILISGMSKCYAMTGWRIGYAAGHPEIMSAIAKVHQYAIMCAPTTSQYGAVEAFKNGDDDIEYMRKEYNYRRRLLLDGFRKLGMSCFEPLGAFYVFPSIEQTGMSSAEFCERLISEQHLAVVPGNAFGDSGEGFIRCSYAYSIDNLKEALKRIEKFLKKL